jgi:SAM-dependent methyltransferase
MPQDLSLGGRILLRFCRAPGTADYATGGIHYESGRELERLEEVFPDFAREIKGKLVIDFGCGEGYQAVAFARSGAARVIGIEIDGTWREDTNGLQTPVWSRRSPLNVRFRMA